ncbi:MAG: hypothetical protein ACTS3F_01230 [Phycisphaerales bacterium]
MHTPAPNNTKPTTTPARRIPRRAVHLPFALPYTIIITILLAATVTLTAEPPSPADELATPSPGIPSQTPGITTIDPTPQRQGDPIAGLHYLLHGDYIGSGIPLDLYELLSPPDPNFTPPITRDPPADRHPLSVNVFDMPSGIQVVAGITCLGCHASTFDGQYIIGLGNSTMDWSDGSPFPSAQLRTLAAASHPPGSPGWNALSQFLRGVDATSTRVTTPFRGVNPAFRIEEVAAAHRIPHTLKWSTRPVFAVPDRVFASDVPPWWHLKKKHALYYNAAGRGDFTKLIQQINVVGIDDADDAKRHNTHMADLLAFIQSIEPPPYPNPIDMELAAEGRLVFANNCAECHGTYPWQDDTTWTYPNKLIPIDIVGTDPEYARAQAESQLSRWFNASWYARTEPKAWATPSLAYIAPPLDGIWITAPYLHNGSIPTIEALLDSTRRPTRWQRSFRDDDYDFQALGWRYQTINPAPPHAPNAPDAPNATQQLPDPTTYYDTTLPGFGNQGHEYGDDLTDTERAALIEYLKTL